MLRILIYYMISFTISHACFAQAFGIAQYTVTHVPDKKELCVKAEFDVDGITDMKIPAAFRQSDVNFRVKNLTISIDKSRVIRNGLDIKFESHGKEHVVVKYTVQNADTSGASTYRSPMIEKEGFYFNSGFLIQPNIMINDRSDVLLSAKIKFNTPVNDVIFTSNGMMHNNVYSDLRFLVDKHARSFIQNVFYINGSSKVLQTETIKVAGSLMNLLFWQVPEHNRKGLAAKIEKIYTAERKFFGPPKSSEFTPFTAFIYNKTLAPEGEAAENINGSIICVTSLKTSDDTLLAHEYIHNWINRSIVGEMADYFMNIWFLEGFTEYYAVKTSFIANIIDKQQVMDLSNWHNCVARLGSLWRKSYLEMASAQYEFFNFYNKGFLLASELDQRITTSTKGQYSLDDVMRTLVKKFQSGTKFSKELLKEEIKKLAGSSFDDIFGAIEYGETFTATTTPFGIKTKLKYVPFYTPKYGFDDSTSTITQKITKLDKSSSAYKAGLREDDFFPRDRNLAYVERNPGLQTISVIIGSGVSEKTITYTTESEKIMVPQYEIVE